MLRILWCISLALHFGLSSAGPKAASGGGAYDFDGDGHVDMSDCAPEDPTRYPGAEEILNDNIDSDCDGFDNFIDDADGDSVDNTMDCMPLDPGVYPGARETPGDGIDSNCDGLD
ncbi:unnamed protein product [Discosporangium mesarthrocarpum]